MSNFGAFAGPTTGKHGPEKLPYSGTFQAVALFVIDTLLIAKFRICEFESTNDRL